MADKWQRVKRKSGYGYVQVNDNNQAVDYDSQTGRFRVFDQPNINSRSYMTEFTDQSKNEANRNPNYTYNVAPMDEVTVTAKRPTTTNFAETSNTSPQSHNIFDAGKEFHYSDPSQYRSSYDRNAFGEVVGAFLRNLSPTQWARRIYDIGDLASGNMSRTQYIDRWINGNNGIVSDKFAQEHPYWSLGINGATDVVTGVGTAGLLNRAATSTAGRSLATNTQRLASQTATRTGSALRNPATGKAWYQKPWTGRMSMSGEPLMSSDDDVQVLYNGLDDDVRVLSNGLEDDVQVLGVPMREVPSEARVYVTKTGQRYYDKTLNKWVNVIPENNAQAAGKGFRWDKVESYDRFGNPIVEKDFTPIDPTDPFGYGSPDDVVSYGSRPEDYGDWLFKKGGTLTINNIKNLKNMENQYEKYQLGGFFKKLFGSRSGSYGGGSFGGGGATVSWDDSTPAKNKKTDRYNISERKVTITASNERKPEEKKQKKAQQQTKPKVLRPIPDQVLPEAMVIAKRPTYTTNFAPELILDSTNPQIHVPINHYDRKTTRQLIRAQGLNPYHMGSLQRRQLRKYLNGELTADQVSPTVLDIAQRELVPNNQVWNNYYPGNQPRSGIVSDIREFISPA